MSEWNVIHENFHTNIECSQRQINTYHTSFSYILWAYGEHIMNKWSSSISDQFMWLVSEKKTEAVNAYLIKNSKGEGGGGRGQGSGGSEGSRKDWAELYGCIKQVSNDQSLQWQSLENLSLSVCLRETENWNSSSETLFYKDCSLGSVKNPSNN